MDKPRHPLVIRPWKAQKTKRNKWNTLPLKAGEMQVDPKAPKIPFAKNERRKPSKKSA